MSRAFLQRCVKLSDPRFCGTVQSSNMVGYLWTALRSGGLLMIQVCRMILQLYLGTHCEVFIFESWRNTEHRVVIRYQAEKGGNEVVSLPYSEILVYQSNKKTDVLK